MQGECLRRGASASQAWKERQKGFFGRPPERVGSGVRYTGSNRSSSQGAEHGLRGCLIMGDIKGDQRHTWTQAASC